MDNTVAIIKDDPHFSKTLKEYMQDRYPEWGIFCFDSEPEKLIYDAYFLDIELQNENKGFALAEKIYMNDKAIPVIFVSSHEELICEGYKFHAMRFIRKNRVAEEIDEAIEALADLFIKQSDEVIVYDMLKVKKRINYKDIQCYYSEGNYVCVLDKNNKVFRRRSTFRQFHKDHEKFKFVLTSNGCMVNPYYIDHINRRDFCLYLKGGQKLDVSQRNMLNLLRRYAAI